MYLQNQIFEMENSLKQTNLIDQDDKINFIQERMRENNNQ